MITTKFIRGLGQSSYLGSAGDEGDERGDDAVVGRAQIRRRRRQLMLQSDFGAHQLRNLFGIMTQLPRGEEKSSTKRLSRG